MNYQLFIDKVKAGHPIQTRDGRPAKFLAHVPEASEDCRILCLVGIDVVPYYEDGIMFPESPGSLDIILAPKPKVKREGWMAVSTCEDYRGRRATTCVYPTEKEAKENDGWICVRIEWEEEQK